MLERGRGYNPEADEESEDNKGDISATIENINSECAHVFDDPEAGEKLEELLSTAEEFSNVDPKGWEKLLTKTKHKILAAEDDMEAITDIVREALTEGTTELM